MTATSVAEPRPHPVAGTQLVRTWEPRATPRGEVVLVHGISEHTGRYENVGSQMAGAAMRVKGADLIGWGATGGRRGDIRDWALYLNQVQSLVQGALETGRPTILLGHSMGGLIALEYALADRPAPDLLVLSAPSLKGGTRFQRRLASLLRRVLPVVPVPAGLSGDQLSRDPRVGEEYFADPLVHTAATVRFGWQLFSAMDRTRANMHHLRISTLLLHGDHDSIVPSTCTVELGAHPRVQRIRYGGLRHELFNEPEGEEIVDDVIDWIDRQLTTPGGTRP